MVLCNGDIYGFDTYYEVSAVEEMKCIRIYWLPKGSTTIAVPAVLVTKALPYATTITEIPYLIS